MAKTLRVIEVKGKYAEAIVAGSRLDKEIKAKTESLKEYKNTLTDKIIKLEPNEQSVKLQAQGTDTLVTLTARRDVAVTETAELKQALKKGCYTGTVEWSRGIVLNNGDVDKVMAILTAAGIKCEEKWNIKTTAADLDKYRKDHGADTILGDAFTIADETYAVKF